MTQAPLIPDVRPTPGGFAGGTMFPTPDGACDVAALRSGQTILLPQGGAATLHAVLNAEESDQWVMLPDDTNGGQVIVSADQLILCRHFLCAALFGSAEVLLRAGDLSGPNVQPSDGTALRFYLPVLGRSVCRGYAKYEYVCEAPMVFGSRAIGEGRARDGGYSDTWTPPVHAPEDAGIARARTLLNPKEAAQVCDSGILFRGCRS